MPTNHLPTPGQDSGNWGTILNGFLTQLLDNANGGGINKFDIFSQRPNNLTANDQGKTYLYTQTGNFHQWSGSDWRVLNESVINVKDYGAIGDGVVDDHGVIQACIDNYNSIFIPTGSYFLGNTLKVDSGKEIVGESKNNTILLRGQNKTDFGRIDNTGFDNQGNRMSDDFNVNAFFALIHTPDGVSIDTWWNVDSKITDLKLVSINNSLVEYGFYAPRFARFTIRDINMDLVKNCVYGNDVFLGIIQKLTGLRTKNLVTILETGTTMNLSDIAGNGHPDLIDSLGYDIRGLNYSSFTHCSIDETNMAYNFINCGAITMNGCGAEKTTPARAGDVIFNIESSRIMMNASQFVFINYFTDKIPTAGSTYFLKISKQSRVILNITSFEPVTGNMYPLFLGDTSGGNSVLISTASNTPTGGLGSVFNGGSSMMVDSGYDITRYTGYNPVERTPFNRENLQNYTDNAEAKSAGLSSGAFYRTGDVLKVVHD